MPADPGCAVVKKVVGRLTRQLLWPARIQRKAHGTIQGRQGGVAKESERTKSRIRQQSPAFTELAFKVCGNQMIFQGESLARINAVSFSCVIRLQQVAGAQLMTIRVSLSRLLKAVERLHRKSPKIASLGCAGTVPAKRVSPSRVFGSSTGIGSSLEHKYHIPGVR